MSRREPFLDATRALLMFTMYGQHLGYWLIRDGDVFGVSRRALEGWPGAPVTAAAGALYIFLQALGGTSAALFTFVSGYAFLHFHGAHGTRAATRRGLTLLALGYALNACVPRWQGLFSWYILHLLGAAYLIAPAFARLGARGLLRAALGFLAAGFALRPLLGASGYHAPAYRHLDMAEFFQNPLELARLALVSGDFPIFPFVGFFLLGMYAFQFRGQPAFGPAMRRPLAVAAIAAAALYALALGPLRGAPGFNPILYWPVSAPLLALLTTLCLALPQAVRWAMARTRALDLLVPAGQTCLSFLFLHIVVFRQLSHDLGFWQRFSLGQTLFGIFAFYAFTVVASAAWARVGYRWGLEWWMRGARAK